MKPLVLFVVAISFAGCAAGGGNPPVANPGSATNPRASASPVRPLTSPPRATRIYFAAMTSTNQPELGLYYSNQDGDVAPDRTIAGGSTGLVNPLAAWPDSSTRWEYVWTCDSTTNAIDGFSGGTWGNIAPSVAIGGGYVPIKKCGDVAVASNGMIVATDALANTIYIWAPNARGNVPPARTIAGPLTLLNHPSGIAFDSAGNILVSNTGSPASIDLFSSGAADNVAPMKFWQTPGILNAPYAIAFDPKHSLIFAANTKIPGEAGSVAAYSLASARGANAPPAILIKGCKTLLTQPLGIAVDFAGYIYVAIQPTDSTQAMQCGASVGAGILTFPPGSAGNYPPVRTITGGSTGLKSVYQLAALPPFTHTSFPSPGVAFEYTMPFTTRATPYGLAAGPDGRMWFTDFNEREVGYVTTAGAFTDLPRTWPANSYPGLIAAGPDGRLWITDENSTLAQLIAITTGGTATTYHGLAGWTLDIVQGPDARMWFTEPAANKIGAMTTTGAITEYAIPTTSSYPDGITVGPDNALWFTERVANKIGRITTTGSFTEYPVTGAVELSFIATGTDGKLWFTDDEGNQVGRMTTSGTVTLYALPPHSTPDGIASGPGGNLYFSEATTGRIAKIVPATATITEYPAIPSGAGGGVETVAAGLDGFVWFVEINAGKIGKLSP